MRHSYSALLKLIRPGTKGFSLAEVMIGVGVLGIVLMALPTTFKTSMATGNTSQNMVIESLVYRDASAILSTATNCTALVAGTSISGGSPIAGGMAQIPLTPGCVPQSTPTPLPSNYSYATSGQTGLCAGAVFDNRLNIAGVTLQNIQAIAGTPNYFADVNISGYKSTESYGGNLFTITLKLLFTGDASNHVLNCLGALTATPQAECVANGGQWVGGMCNMCSAYHGFWNGQYCEMPSNNCLVPAGTAWLGRNNFTECNITAAVPIPNGSTVPLIDSSAPLPGGEEFVQCTDGFANVVGQPTCYSAQCQAPPQNWDSSGPNAAGPCATTWTVYIPVGQGQTASNTTGTYSGSASWFCPVAGGAPVPVLPWTCNTGATACNIAAGTLLGAGLWQDAAGNNCLPDSNFSVAAGASGSVTDTTGPTTGSITCTCPSTGGACAFVGGTCGTSCVVTSTTNWGGGNCVVDGSFVGHTIGNGSTLPVTDTGSSGYAGSATLSCSNGTITATAPSCTAVGTGYCGTCSTDGPSVGPCTGGGTLSTAQSAACTCYCNLATPSVCAALPNIPACVSPATCVSNCTSNPLPAYAWTATSTSMLVPNPNPTPSPALVSCGALDCGTPANWPQCSGTTPTCYKATSEIVSCSTSLSANGQCEVCQAYSCAATTSDLRLKTDITRVGRENGFDLYAFKYKHGFSLDGNDNQYYVGVMAQDVLRTRPDAIVTMANGYFAVRYDMIGVKFRKFDGGGLCE